MAGDASVTVRLDVTGGREDVQIVGCGPDCAASHDHEVRVLMAEQRVAVFATFEALQQWLTDIQVQLFVFAVQTGRSHWLTPAINGNGEGIGNGDQ